MTYESFMYLYLLREVLLHFSFSLEVVS